MLPEQFCPHAGVCGGCSLLNLSYAEQLRFKEAAISNRLAILTRSQGGVVRPKFEPLFAEEIPPRGFRQKVAFVFGSGPGGRGLVMGHYARGSQNVVPVAECPVHCNRGNRVAFTLRDHLIRAGVTAATGS